MPRRVPAALTAALALCLGAASARAAEWVSKGGEVTYHLVHKLHAFDATTTKVEALAIVDEHGLKVMARAPVASFDSKNANRDAHMLEVVDAAQHPLVTIKALAPSFVLPAAGKGTVHLEGQVELNGVKAPVPIEAEVDLTTPGRAIVRFKLATKLTAHGIERPSLLFVPVDDDLNVTGVLTMEPKP
jgi:polyisoprenoid-binding protein YceI